MAAEQPGAGQVRADDAEAAAAAQPDAASGVDETKRKFREALERKRGTHATAEGARDTGKIHGSHGPAASRRSFRRKSGG